MGCRVTDALDAHKTHFLSVGFGGTTFVNDMATACCSVIVALPFANGFDIYSPTDKAEARILHVMFTR